MKVTRNLPQERSNEIARKIKELPHPSVNDERYLEKKQRYDAIVKFWLEKKSEYDDLAHAVDMAINPDKRLKCAKMYQQLHKNSDRMKALKIILKKK